MGDAECVLSARTRSRLRCRKADAEVTIAQRWHARVVQGETVMHITEFFIPGNYDNPLTASGRGRTIAAFHLALGNVDTLTQSDMRRDVLNDLMSKSAVNYWLNTQGWLEKSMKAGNVQLLRLTDSGLRTCANSIAGGSNVPTTKALVDLWRNLFLQGGPSCEKRTYKQLLRSGE